MTTGQEIALIVSILGGICGIVFGVVSILRNRKQDDTDEGKQIGVVLTELGYIKKGVDNVERKQDEQDKQYKEILKDLTAVQESAKQAHHRIDGLEERVK